MVDKTKLVYHCVNSQVQEFSFPCSSRRNNINEQGCQPMQSEAGIIQGRICCHMKVVVNDANILIDLVKLQLLPHFFALDWEFHTTSLVLDEWWTQTQ